MKKVLTPRRHAVPVTEVRYVSPEESSAAIARGRHEMAMKLMRRFPKVRILGIEGKGEILIELPDDDELLRRIRSELDAETGPAPGDAKGMPVWRDLKPTIETVADAHRAKEYRPTVVAFIRDPADRILLVQSVHNHDEWMFVQGGIETGESPLAALGRELGEELVDVAPGSFSTVKFVAALDLDFEDGRPDKRGFTKGKRYFVYEVLYRGPEELKVQGSELNGYAWVGPRLDDPGLLTRLKRVREGKAHFLLGIVIRTLR